MARGHGHSEGNAAVRLQGFLMPRVRPPKPPSRPSGAGIWTRLKLFRRDMFRSQPERLYTARMAQIKTPLYDSVLVNEPEIISDILEARAADFPKAGMIGDTLRPLLGDSVFVTNGPKWTRQRRLIDPAFAAGRLRDTFPAMLAATQDAVARLQDGPCEMEFETAHLAADIIFRTLFSMPIDAPVAREVFDAFRDYQRAQPLLSPLDLVRAPSWIPRKRPGLAEAQRIRDLLTDLVQQRTAQIAAGSAPDDLATAILQAEDPDGGPGFSPEEMVDQVAIFFLAGHETSASALSWGLYCLACDPEAQAQIRAEVEEVMGDGPVSFEHIPKLRFTRDVFREVLRLYPPVPMMVRQSTKPETFRDRPLRKGTLAILSPWHMHRHTRHWPDADVFDPWRWSEEATRHVARGAYFPFSKGPRVCTGAGFAMLEGVLTLALLVRAFHVAPTAQVPVPVAHLTVRSEAGIHLHLTRRAGLDTT